VRVRKLRVKKKKTKKSTEIINNSTHRQNYTQTAKDTPFLTILNDVRPAIYHT